MTTPTTLERELYSTAEAAALLRLSTVTLRRWLDGAERKGTFYEPVIRAERRAGELADVVTWGEFVEAGFLREYRTRGVPLQQLRPVIERLRAELGVLYPLAHSRPFVGEGRRLLLDAQESAGIDQRLYIVISNPQGQLVLSDVAERFIDRVDFAVGDDGYVQRLWPAGKDARVVIDPDFSFGIPTVQGIRVENIVELFKAGESVDTIADTYELDDVDVEAAIRFDSVAAA